VKSSNFCPNCKKNVTNGVGPSGLPEVTKFLHNLPSSHLFFHDANWHDLAYHIGRTEEDRKKADETFLENMLYTVKIECSPWAALWFKLSAYRNYYAVKLLGKRFFNYRGCGASSYTST